MLTFFCITNCQTCQKAKAWLSQHQVDYNFRNIAKEPPEEAELKRIAQLSGYTLKELVNTKGQAYRKLKPDLSSMDESKIMELIQENPTIMLRPVLMNKKGLVIGFNEEKYEEFLKSLDSQNA